MPELRKLATSSFVISQLWIIVFTHQEYDGDKETIIKRLRASNCKGISWAGSSQ